MESPFSTPKIESLKSEFREFLQQEVYPHEVELLNGHWETFHSWAEEKRKIVKKNGWWAGFLPKELGGMGLDLVEFAQVSEVLGTSPFGHYLFNCQAPDVGNMELLSHRGSTELKDTYLKPLTQGEIRSCFSMTEPEFAGSNPVMMGTTAVLENGQWVINGHKWFTSSADGSDFAIVMAVTDPENESPYQQASMILVPTNTPGFNLVRNIPVMGEAGGGYLSHAEIRYEDCRVPESNLLGERGKGFQLAQERLGPGRIHHCMRWIGICERAFDLMVHRASTRRLSLKSMLGEKQTIQNWIAESRASIDAARLMVLNTAWKMQKHGQKATRLDVSTIKFFVAGILLKVLDRAIQTHGAMGITDDLVLAWWYRHERGARIYDGPDEVHKSALARKILKGNK